MKKLCIGSLSLIVILAACSDEMSATSRITTSGLKALLDKGTALPVDVRDKSAYDQGHIKGALSMPLEEVVRRFNELPRDKKIVTYCS